ncbi:snakin-2-like [Aristolochia californica]|uniref:snakin-2-like n=1 Tax=Aristolochia californica TaxID=171875 RepID=UPI0035D71FD5
MALFKALLVSVLLFLLLAVHLVDARFGSEEHTLATNDAGDSPPQKINCGTACAARCRLSSRPNLCKRACGTCCAKCNCVPPGTYGNQEQCACYASLTTRGNKPKCP